MGIFLYTIVTEGCIGTTCRDICNGLRNFINRCGLCWRFIGMCCWGALKGCIQSCFSKEQWKACCEVFNQFCCKCDKMAWKGCGKCIKDVFFVLGEVIVIFIAGKL